MTLKTGQTLSHYRIVGRIGAGGMGEVYRAEDTRLGRHVALKVLPEEMASDPARLSRFQREARTVASLSHPNIVTLFSVEEDGGTHFLTMELVEGRPLSERIPPEGRRSTGCSRRRSRSRRPSRPPTSAGSRTGTSSRPM
jgi:serine/threonine protein kinase